MEDVSGFPTKSQLRDLKRREIIRCAAARFGSQGFENVPLDAIASDIGVTKAALYNYVASKNDLLMQCYEVGMDRLVAAVEAATAPEGTAAQKLDAGLQAYIVTMTQPDMQFLWIYTRPMIMAGKQRIIRAVRDRLDTIMRDLLANGVKDGSLRADLDPKLSSLVILGAVNWVGIWYNPNGPQKPEDIAREIARETLYGYLNNT
ncbi:TetR/AcrR family transcriptional regulator [Sulfitobacter sp. M57]|uniref:TetR/AcrR family transcriptional regulator n=1 Tax=unclassified Sulfitobacter TaxID=196795 RepID=UPI0023E266BB|nr:MULTISPECIES: TetR/AcrR family transcriptional regulator [unclassified Sulfitobacter]MDF3414594.1 TetR/AcrR family transcriptional regulator [Sulfitobacter sp. KE5]MDF3422076.1 TetR/AcrR family transcriptional regulator [Sulfitobacter sp. KE43]MDF3433141.1 TetR/AcrR family transcriptional regulator [Sulfitobacter sp. KE42]MDF3458781.1 TetR/AcrR family transcriptional regulator [Sulfitobacter sp. S74]MDF3462680.1 TetR/AcrR family transcriptional regulator [Sulfitobacter sp. Ks18]